MLPNQVCINATTVCEATSPFHAAHRALADVEAMEDIFLTSALVEMLSSLPKRSTTQQLLKVENTEGAAEADPESIMLVGEVHHRSAGYSCALTCWISHTRRCVRSGRLVPDFQTTLSLQRGVRSRPLKEKLTALVPKSR